MKFFSALMLSSTAAYMVYIIAKIAEATLPFLSTPYLKEIIAIISGIVVLLLRLIY